MALASGLLLRPQSIKQKFLRNHPTIVYHMPELVLIWGANIEGRPLQSYKQVLRHLLKYMFKDEPNSACVCISSKVYLPLGRPILFLTSYFYYYYYYY